MFSRIKITTILFVIQRIDLKQLIQIFKTIQIQVQRSRYIVILMKINLIMKLLFKYISFDANFKLDAI